MLFEALSVMGFEIIKKLVLRYINMIIQTSKPITLYSLNTLNGRMHSSGGNYECSSFIPIKVEIREMTTTKQNTYRVLMLSVDT